MTFIGHGTLMFRFDGQVIHVDPWSDLADYSGLPKADLILITHGHRDHLDPASISSKPTRTDPASQRYPCRGVAASAFVTVRRNSHPIRQRPRRAHTITLSLDWPICEPVAVEQRCVGRLLLSSASRLGKPDL